MNHYWRQLNLAHLEELGCRRLQCHHRVFHCHHDRHGHHHHVFHYHHDHHVFHCHRARRDHHGRHGRLHHTQ